MRKREKRVKFTEWTLLRTVLELISASLFGFVGCLSSIPLAALVSILIGTESNWGRVGIASTYFCTPIGNFLGIIVVDKLVFRSRRGGIHTMASILGAYFLSVIALRVLTIQSLQMMEGDLGMALVISLVGCSSVIGYHIPNLLTFLRRTRD